MAFDIKRTDSLSERERQHLFFWGEDVFGANEFALEWRPKSTHFLLYEDENLLSHVGLLQHTIEIDDIPLTVAGVGGVVTLPVAQKKGCASLLMRCAEEFFREEWRVEAGLLFCLPRMIAYYERFDWKKITQPVLIEQPQGEIESPLEAMILSCSAGNLHDKKIRLKSLPW